MEVLYRSRVDAWLQASQAEHSADLMMDQGCMPPQQGMAAEACTLPTSTPAGLALEHASSDVAEMSEETSMQAGLSEDPPDPAAVVSVVLERAACLHGADAQTAQLQKLFR